MVKKWSREKLIFYAIIPALIYFLVKVLLVMLKNLYIQYASVSIMEKQNSNQNVRAEKVVVLVKTFDHFHHKFQLFSLSCKTVK